MRRFRPGLSITRAAVFVLLACAARVAVGQGAGGPTGVGRLRLEALASTARESASVSWGEVGYG